MANSDRSSSVMATTTPNFGWTVPTSTDLVKDGATAIELLGDSIDGAFVDLKGGTTGQVLAKASGTDLDFAWVAQDDSNAIQNAIMDAKGDIIGATAADTPARLAVGANNTVLTADSSTATGLKWATPASSGGMTLLATSTFTSASSVSINDVFSATYDNYLIMGTITATDNGDVNYRFRVGGADNSTANYNFQVIDIDGTGVAASRNAGVTFGRFVATKTGGERSSFSSTIMSPFLGITKHYLGQGVLRTNSTTFANNISGGFNTTTSFTGLTLLAAAGTISGTVRVYGIQNA